MKKKIVMAIVMLAALTACGQEEPRGPMPQQTETDGQPDTTDTEKPIGSGDVIIDVIQVPDNNNDPEPVDTEIPGPEDDELIYGECKAERKLQSLDVSELPGDLDLCLSVYSEYGDSTKFDHTDIDILEQRLAGFIDRGTVLYQVKDLSIDKEHFVPAQEEDPRGGYTEYGYYFSMDKKTTDRWFEALYNCAEDDIDRINEKWDNGTFLSIEARYDNKSSSTVDISVRSAPYSEDGKYYFYDIDAWAESACCQGRPSRLEPVRVIGDIAYDGVFYYIKFTEYEAWEYFDNNDSTEGLEGMEHDAVLKWKELDGKQFWSLYYMDMGKFPGK